MKRKAKPAKRGFIGSAQIHRMADRQGQFKPLRDVPANKPFGKYQIPADWEDVTPSDDEAGMIAIIGHPRPK